MLALVFAGLASLSLIAWRQEQIARSQGQIAIQALEDTRFALSEVERQRDVATRAKQRAAVAQAKAEKAARAEKTAADQAEEEAQNARKQEDIAVAEKVKADLQRSLAEEKTREAESQKENARREKENADEQRGIAEKQKEIAVRAQADAEGQARVAEEQTRIAEGEKFKAELLAVKAELLAASSRIEKAFNSGQQLIALLEGVSQGYDNLNSDASNKVSQRSVVDQLSFNTTLRKIVDDIQQTNQWPGHTSPATKLLFNPDPDSEFAIASLDEYATLSLWDKNGRPLNTISTNAEALFSTTDSDFAFNPQGTEISYANQLGEVVNVRLEKALLLSEGRLDADANNVDEVTGGFFNSYAFDGQANQTISIHLESQDFDTYLRLFDASGKEIAENDDYNNYNSFLEYPLPETGQYQVVVTSFSAGSTGSYKLSISPDLDKVILPAHSSPIVGLGFAPDGTLVTAGEDGYVKLWSDALNPLSTPTLQVNLGFIDEEVQAGFSEANRNNLLSGGLYNEHRYSGHKDERIAITLESNRESDLDTLLRLVHSDGHVTDNYIAEDDDSGTSYSSLLAIDLPRDDDYRIIATTYEATQSRVHPAFALSINTTPVKVNVCSAFPSKALR